MFDPNVIQYDADDIRTAKQRIKAISMDIDNTRKSILSTIESMKNDWNTTEGKKFISEVDVDWSSQVDKYVRILNTLCDMLDETTYIYSDLNSKIRTIKF